LEDGPEDVHPAAGEGDNGLMVAFSLASFAVDLHDAVGVDGSDPVDLLGDIDPMHWRFLDAMNVQCTGYRFAAISALKADAGRHGGCGLGIEPREPMCGRARLSSDVSEIKLEFAIPADRPPPNFAPSSARPRSGCRGPSTTCASPCRTAGLEVSYETVRGWVLKFGATVAQRLRKRRPRPSDRRHLDEMVVRIAGGRMYLWRAVDHEGEILDMLLQRRRDKAPRWSSCAGCSESRASPASEHPRCRSGDPFTGTTWFASNAGGAARCSGDMSRLAMD
jgi:hypothetical protein